MDVVRLDTQMRSVLQSVRDEDLQLTPEAEPNLRFVDSDEAKRALDGAVQGWGHVTNSATCAALCTATFDRSLVAGEEVVVTVRAMDAQGRPRTDGGDRVRVVLSSSAAASAASAKATSVAAEAKDAHDGSYEARVTVGADWDDGAGALAVTVNGRHVRESPFGVHISAVLPLRLTPPSQILDLTMAATLAKMCSPMDGGLRQLLATNESTNRAASFDAAVKGIGRVIVLIRTTAGHVFGCYVHVTFGDVNGWVVDDGAFLFALGNLTHAPVKLKAAPGAGQVYIGGNCGLHVGYSPNELVTFCAGNNSCGMPTQFTLLQDFAGCKAAPVTLSEGYLCGTPGTKAFTPSRMEVYTFT